MSKEISRRLTALWIFAAFAAWVFIFRGYLTSQFIITGDAISYYDHTKFFIDNLKRGVYPLWDPYWSYGVSNDFFLRRIGAFNPFYLIILFLKVLGIPFTLAYLWSLAAYYWSGMIAFYLLAMRFYSDRWIAYAGYLMLLFSALGTRLFDSYLMLVTVPLIWFFYFLTAFTMTPRKHLFLGMTLSFMVLAGTYIPLYFLVIISVFLAVFAFVFFNRTPQILRSYAGFFKINKALALFALTGLVFSILPAIIFFHNSALGQMVLPIRHADAGAGQTLSVPHRISDWGAVEALFYSAFFSDLRQYKFEIIYVPFFAVIVLVLGLIGRIQRRGAFIFLLGAALFCIIVPHGFPFYDFLYRHIFFLKLFRNLHFFIWFFLIPLFVLLVLEHWKMFMDIGSEGNENGKTLRRRLLLLYVLCVHAAALLFVLYRNDAVLSTYIMIFLSLVFWTLTALKKLQPNAWGFALLTLTVIIQPWEVYHYLSLKSSLYTRPYDYDLLGPGLRLKETGHLPAREDTLPKAPLYYASSRYNFIYQNINNYALSKYLQNRFILVDRIKAVDRRLLDTAGLERHFLADDNTAVVFNDTGPVLKLTGNDPQPPPKPLRVDEHTPGFKLLDFNADRVRLSVDVAHEKFLIYNDSYDPQWRVTVNHRQSRLYEVNGAFKGTWIPAGRSVVEFSYGPWWQYGMNIFLSILAFIFLAGIIWYGRLAAAGFGD